MPLEFKLNDLDSEKLEFALEDWIVQMKDWRSIWPKVISQMTGIEERQFASTGALGAHGDWAALTPEYEKRKKRIWGAKPILEASGKLRSAAVGGGPGHIETLEPLRMHYGVSSDAVPYAIYHQTGTSKMPARRIFDFTREDRAVIQRTIQVEALNVPLRLGFGIATGEGTRGANLTQAPNLGGSPLLGWDRGIAEPGTSLSQGL